MTLNTLIPTSTCSKRARWYRTPFGTRVTSLRSSELAKVGKLYPLVLVHAVSVAIAHDTIAPNDGNNEGNYATKEISANLPSPFFPSFLLSFLPSFLPSFHPSFRIRRHIESTFSPRGSRRRFRAISLPALPLPCRWSDTAPSPRDDKTLFYPRRDWFRRRRRLRRRRRPRRNETREEMKWKCP